MAVIVDGNKIAEEILNNLTLRLRSGQGLRIKPRLVVFLVGQNPASTSYVKVKKKRAEEVGIEVEIRDFPETVSQSELRKEIASAAKDRNTHGIIIQLPLPNHFDREQILNTVPAEVDVDCLTTINKQKLIKGEKVFLPPAPAAILKILEYYQVDLTKANILIVGSGELVGKPLSAMLLNRRINFKLANRYTKNLAELIRQADVIITGVGKPGLINGEMVKEGVVVIDAGTTGSETGNRDLVGDVDIDSVLPKAGLLSPVPGGVGPVTVAMLLQNVVDSALDIRKAA